MYCSKCGKEYELKDDEKPSNYQCDCGGKLDYKKNIDDPDKLVDWRAFIFKVIATAFLGLFLGWFGYIIATILIGYYVNRSYKHGAVNGALAAFIASVIIVIYSDILYTIINGSIGFDTGFRIVEGSILGVVVYTTTGAIGGLIGVFIKNKRSKS